MSSDTQPPPYSTSSDDQVPSYNPQPPNRLDAAIHMYNYSRQISVLRAKIHELCKNKYSQHETNIANYHTFQEIMVSKIIKTSRDMTQLIDWLLNNYPPDSNTPLMQHYRDVKMNNLACYFYGEPPDRFLKTTTKRKYSVSYLLSNKTTESKRYIAYINAFNRFCYEPAYQAAITKITTYDTNYDALVSPLNSLIAQRDSMHYHAINDYYDFDAGVVQFETISYQYDSICTICCKMNILRRIMNEEDMHDPYEIIKILHTTEAIEDTTTCDPDDMPISQLPTFKKLLTRDHIFGWAIKLSAPKNYSIFTEMVKLAIVYITHQQ